MTGYNKETKTLENNSEEAFLQQSAKEQAARYTFLNY